MKGAPREHWMKHKGGMNEGGSQGALDETQGRNEGGSRGALDETQAENEGGF